MQSKKHFEFTYPLMVTKFQGTEPISVNIGEYTFTGEAESAISFSIERVVFKRNVFGNWNTEVSDLLTNEKVEEIIEEHLYGIFPKTWDVDNYPEPVYPSIKFAS